MNVEIFRAQPSDAEAIRQVYSDAYRENRELGFPASAETTSAEAIVDWIQSDRVWIAKFGGKVIGAVRVRERRQSIPVLGRLGVSSEFKNKGVGKRLILAAEEDMRLRGNNEIQLMVAERHPYLTKIYLKLGYQILGPRTPQPADYNETVMRKFLGPNP